MLLVVLGDVNLVTDVRDLLNWGFGDFSRWYSPLLVPVVYAPEYFGWDGPGLWVPLANGGRYYARSGHTVQPPLLAPYVQGRGDGALRSSDRRAIPHRRPVGAALHRLMALLQPADA